ncbi:hypothetical protein VNO78_10422 [Psophocarpus tetragonolobus]|uniref:Uncharacterized protein n=1 Tax=Psophocarpus tetragonolobus TaxID=3891 RepID=A0AAN9SKQ1_PSOTE
MPGDNQPLSTSASILSTGAKDARVHVFMRWWVGFMLLSFRCRESEVERDIARKGRIWLGHGELIVSRLVKGMVGAVVASGEWVQTNGGNSRGSGSDEGKVVPAKKRKEGRHKGKRERRKRRNKG